MTEWDAKDMILWDYFKIIIICLQERFDNNRSATKGQTVHHITFIIQFIELMSFVSACCRSNIIYEFVESQREFSKIVEMEFTRHPLITIETETPSEKIRSNSLTLTVPLVSPVIPKISVALVVWFRIRRIKRLEAITGKYFIQHPPNTTI